MKKLREKISERSLFGPYSFVNAQYKPRQHKIVIITNGYRTVNNLGASQRFMIAK